MRKTLIAILATSFISSGVLAQNYPQQPYPNQQYPQQGQPSYPPQYPNQPYPPQGGYNNGYQNQWQDQNFAINICNQAVLQEAARFGRPQMGQIGSIEQVRGGFKIKGGVSAAQPPRDFGRDGEHRAWDRRDGERRDGDWRGRGPIIRQGSYTCEVKYGKINKLRVRDLGDPIRR